MFLSLPWWLLFASIPAHAHGTGDLIMALSLFIGGPLTAIGVVLFLIGATFKSDGAKRNGKRFLLGGFVVGLPLIVSLVHFKFFR